MKLDENGDVCEPCLSCDKPYVDNLFYEWQCDADCEFNNVGKGGADMTPDEATAIIKNLKNYLENEDKVKDKKLHEDVYAAIDMAIEVMGEKNMTRERAKEIMQIERACVLRQDTPECNRDECGCQACDLVQDAEEVIAAYDFVIGGM